MVQIKTIFKINLKNYLEETKIEKDTCTPGFTAVLCTITKTWNQTRSPSNNDRMKKLWYTYTEGCYSAIKRKASELVLKRRMNLKPITQSGMSERGKQVSHINTYTRNPERWYL